MSAHARFMIGITLLLVPTIVYGGVTVLGVLSSGAYGAPGPSNLAPMQKALYRAGHAHAGVLVLLSLLLQLALDHAELDATLIWVVRIASPTAAGLVSGGFFGLAHLPSLRVLLYTGALLVVFATLTTGFGLVRRGL